MEGEIGFGLIFMVGEVFNQTVTSSGDTYVYAAIITPQGCSKGVSIAEGGFTVQQSATSPMDGKRSMLNQSRQELPLHPLPAGGLGFCATKKGGCILHPPFIARILSDI